jgi:predicted SAM-dependent methyltransferase
MRLNIGCGAHPLAYWVNADADETVHADMHFSAPPIPFEDDALDAIHAGHVLEHMGCEQGRAFLVECYRVLSPGGVLSVVVPDTREVMRRYLAGANDAVEYPAGVWWSVADLDSVCHVFLYSDIQPSPHRWAYDRETLGRAMASAGFADLREMDRYRDPRIAQGAWYQVGVEGRK